MTQQPTNAEKLGQFIAGTPARKLPAEVADAARLCLADWLAVAIGARGEDAGAVVRATISRWGSSGRSTVLFGGTAAAPMAALANGTLAHCLDFDDTYIPSITHTSAPVWAATLALGQAQQASEEQMLAAFVTGFEVVARFGNGWGQALTSRGLHGTGVFGRIGAAAASAALLGLDAQQCQHALATAATQASGLVASFGTMAKPFHAGKAAMDGVVSAELAQAGFIAAPNVLEAGGLDRALIQDGTVTVPSVSFEGWEILNNSFKPYAACHLVHPAVDAARQAGVAANRIKAIRAEVSPLAMQITGGASGRPSTPLAAKFDLRYCIALGLNDRPVSAGDFFEPWTANAAALAFADRIATAADASLGFASARLTLDFVDGGSRIIAIPTAKGHPGNPMQWSDMADKLDGLATPVMGSGTGQLLEATRRFGDGKALSAITAMLQPLSAAA